MSEAEVRARVEAFIADFHAAWQRSGSAPMPAVNPFAAGSDAASDAAAILAWAQTAPDFEAWDRELARLVADHFTDGARTGAEGVLSGRPDHAPGAERILEVEVKRVRATVKTWHPDGGMDNYFTYRLTAADDGWRIGKIVHTSKVPDTRLLPADEAQRLVGAVDAAADPDDPAVAGTLARGVTSLFSAPHDVVELGTLTTSGVLAVHDMGLLGPDLVPLRRRAPAGSHPVELSRDGVTNVALRLRFSDAAVSTRVAALRVDRDDHVVGVDAGNVAIADFMALTSTVAVRVEEVYQHLVEQAPTSAGAVFSLAGVAPDAAMVTSGYGDGAYPVYWGLAADGSVVDLVVDFLVAVEEVTSTVAIPWRQGVSTDGPLAEHQFEVVVEPDAVLFRYRPEVGQRHVADVRVLLPDSEPVPGEEGGVFVRAGVDERRWTPAIPIPDAATVEVTLSHGYRHTR